MNTSMSREQCRLWGEPLSTDPRPAEDSYLIYSPRAGGVYRLEGLFGHGISEDLLTQAPLREKANLSHWIYRQNLEAGLLFPDHPTSPRRHTPMSKFSTAELVQRAPTLDEATVRQQYPITPPAPDRLLYLMREMLRQQDSPLPEDQDRRDLTYWDYQGFRRAATAVASTSEETEFREHIQAQGWAIFPKSTSHVAPHGEAVFPPAVCSLKARLWVEEQLQERGTGQQVFVAMWFDKSLDEVYEEGFKKGIKEARYDAKRTDDDTHHSDKLDDRVMADIRQSRIVVADFTCEKFIREGHTECEGLPNGNVHYEAGFAHGLGRPVIYTCRADCEPYLRFDTRQINHIFWRDAADLARQLQERLEGQFGHGPVVDVPDA